MSILSPWVDEFDKRARGRDRRRCCANRPSSFKYQILPDYLGVVNSHSVAKPEIQTFSLVVVSSCHGIDQSVRGRFKAKGGKRYLAKYLQLSSE